MNRFDVFQKEFTKRQQQFGLTGYKIYFDIEELLDTYGDITVDGHSMVATVRLNKQNSEKERPSKSTDKHEAIHLLLAPLTYKARDRYATPDELYRVEEEIVNKLEGLIP